jgi:hypothetical protein
MLQLLDILLRLYLLLLLLAFLLLRNKWCYW